MRSARSRSTSALALAAGLTVLLGGCDSGSDSSSSAAAGSTSSSSVASAAGPTARSSAVTATPGPGSTSAGSAGSGQGGCGDAPTGTDVVATSAQAQGSTVVVTATPARFVCGGADNGHDETDPTSTTLTVGSTAQIRVLAGSGPDLDPTPLSPADLPAWLAGEPAGVLFQVTGPESAVTGLTELYQP